MKADISMKMFTKLAIWHMIICVILINESIEDVVFH